MRQPEELYTGSLSSQPSERRHPAHCPFRPFSCDFTLIEAPPAEPAFPLAYALSSDSITAAEVAEAVERPTAEVARELDAVRGLIRDGQIYRVPVEILSKVRPER